MAFSSDPFERLGFGEVYSRSFVLLMERLDLFMIVAVLMYVPFLILQVTFPGLDNPEAENPFVENEGQEGAEKVVYGKLAGFYAEIFFSTFIGIVGNSAIAVAVAQMYVNGHPDTMACLKQGLSKFCTLLIGQFLFGAAVGGCIAIGAFICILLWVTEIKVLRMFAVLLVTALIVGYFYCAVAMTLYIPAVMIEGKGSVGGLRRSFELVTHNFCFVFCTSFCLTLIVGVISAIFSIFTLDGLLGTAIEKIPFLFQFPLQSILIVVVYFNLRITHEGMNRDVLARELNTTEGEYDPIVVAEEVEAQAVAVAVVDDDKP